MGCTKLFIIRDEQSYEIKLNQDDNITLSLSVKDFENIFSPDTSNTNIFSFAINIPYDCNEKALGHVIDINSKAGRQLRGKNTQAVIDCDGLCIRGTLYYDSYSIENNVKTISTQFISGIADFLENAPKELCDLTSLGSLPFSQSDVEATWTEPDAYDGTNPILFALVNFGGYRDLGYVPLSCIEPVVHEKAIIEAIEKQSGVQIKSAFFNSEYFRKKVRSFGNSCKWVMDGYGYDLTAPMTTPFTVQEGNLIPFNNWQIFNGFGTGILDLSSIAGTSLFVEAPYSGAFKMKFELEINNLNSSVSNSIEISEFAQGTPGLQVLETIAVDQNGIQSFEVEVDLSAGFATRINFVGDYEVTAGKIRFCTRGNLGGDRFYIAESLACETIEDYIEDLTSLHNLVWFYDKKRECIITEPAFDTVLQTGEKINGFFQKDAKDWRSTVVCDEESGEFRVENVSRTLKFKFCDDNDDENIQESFGTCQLELCNKYERGETEFETKLAGVSSNDFIFKSFDDGTINENPPYVPTVLNYSTLDNDTVDEKTCSDKMRVYERVGLIDGNWAFTNETNILTQYPYITQYDQARGINLLWCDRGGIPGRVSTFYTQTINIYNWGVKKTLTVKFPKKAINNLEDLFRKMKYVDLLCSGQGYNILDEISQAVLDECIVAKASLISACISGEGDLLPPEVSEPCNASVVIESEALICNYTISVEHPDDGTDNFKIINIDDSQNIGYQGRCIVTNSCITDPVSDIVETDEAGRSYRNFGPQSGTFMVAGGFIESFTITSSTGGQQFIDVNPNTSPHLAGVTASDLIFGNTTPALHAAALTQVIENALSTIFGATNGTDYDLLVNIFSSGSFAIRFYNKHNPAAQWIGINFDDTSTYNTDGSTPTPGRFGRGTTGGGVFLCSFESPCGTLTYTTPISMSGVVNSLQSWYNNIVLLTNVRSIPPSSGGTQFCASPELILTAVVSDCLSPNYDWQENVGGNWNSIGQTTQSISITNSGTYRVVVTCIDGCIAISEEIIV